MMMIQAGTAAILDKFIANLDESRKKAIETSLMATTALPSPSSPSKRPSISGGGGGRTSTSGAAKSNAVSVSSLIKATSASTKPKRPPSAAEILAATKGAPASPAVGSSKRNGLVKLVKKSGSTSGAKAAGGAKAGGGGGGGGGAVDDDSDAALAFGAIPQSSLMTKLTEALGEELIKELSSEEWKVRLSAMDQVVEFARVPSNAETHCQTLVQGIAVLPGWKELNFQVMSRMLEVIKLCTPYPSFSRHEASIGVSGGFDKLSDLKLKGPASEMLLAVAEAAGPQLVAVLVHRKAGPHKNPKVGNLISH